MGIEIDLSNVYKKLSDGNIQAGRRAFANQALIDMNENFVPKLDGNLRQFVGIDADGTGINWYSVYARAQYYGAVKSKSGSWSEVKNYTTPGTGPYWDLKAKGMFMSDWVDAFTKGAGL